MMTIPPYWPALNAAEKIILAIKQKMKKYEDQKGKIKQVKLLKI